MKKMTCQRCGHTWIPRIDDVKVCPKCHSYRWNEKKG
jgi:Zn finger protein HypA/HybF involved in hydrogenase expression